MSTPTSTWAIRAVTLVMALLAYAALDDITTDAGGTFVAEYAFLAACACWLAFVGVRAIRTGRL
jgi:hypothetical protein